MPIPNDAAYLSDRFVDVDAAFERLSDADQRDWMIRRKGFARKSGATHVPGAPMVAGGAEHELDYNSSTPISDATLAQFLAGEIALADASVIRHMALPSILSDTPATIESTEVCVITLDGARIADQDDHDSHSLVTTFEPSADRAICVGDIHPGLTLDMLRVYIANPDASAKAITFVDHPDGGATIDLAGLVIPALPASAGAQIILYLTIVSATKLRLERVQEVAA